MRSGTTRAAAAIRLDLRIVRAAALAAVAAALVRPELPDVVPPCPLRTATGVPCPLCGMTRGVTAAVHGDLGRALLMSPAALVAVAATVLLMVSWRTKRVTLPVWVLGLAVAAMWSWQLFKYATGRPL